ncbi:hypothetical protein WDU94_007409 [Cyamophila willieti]
MMVLESGVLPPTLRLYAEAIAAASNNNSSSGNGNGSSPGSNNCFSSSQIMAPHPLFPHFAAAGRGFPSMFSGLPPFLHHAANNSPVTQHPRFNPANLLNACSTGASNQQRSNENHPRIEISSRRRQRHHTSNSDDSTEDPMSPKKGTNTDMEIVPINTPLINTERINGDIKSPKVKVADIDVSYKSIIMIS